MSGFPSHRGRFNMPVGSPQPLYGWSSLLVMPHLLGKCTVQSEFPSQGKIQIAAVGQGVFNVPSFTVQIHIRVIYIQKKKHMTPKHTITGFTCVELQ